MKRRLLVITATMLSIGCASDDGTANSSLTLPMVPVNLADAIPSPERNPLTIDGAALGRRLFYDPLLSANNEVACATCHIQEHAFSDGDSVSSAGVSGQALLRNTPALINLAWMGGYFWDGGGYDLESQAFAPIEHVDEMAQDLNELMDELAAHSDYLTLFSAAFEDGLTLPNVVRALAQFERTLISANAPYDRFVRGEDPDALTNVELHGLALFEGLCGGCHATDFFTDQSYRNNGLDTVYPDDHERVAWGRARITDDLADLGKYKVPTLRNIVLTAPYMHDGRFETLDDVLAHYRFGVQDTDTLDPLLRGDGGALGIPMTDDEAALLLLFLETLTDEDFLTNPAYSAP